MNKVKYQILFLIGIILIYAYLKSHKNPSPQENVHTSTAEAILSQPVTFQQLSGEKAKAPEAKTALNPSSDKSSEDQEAHSIPNLSIVEISRKIGRNFVDGCKYIDDRNGVGQGVNLMELNGDVDRKKLESRLRLAYTLSLFHFQISLPTNLKLLNELENGSIKLKSTEYESLLSESRSELAQNLNQASLVALRAYYAMILGRILFYNPSRFGDPDLVKDCAKVSNIDNRLDRSELNAIIYRNIERAQVQTSQIRFDPQFDPQVKIVDGPEGVVYISQVAPDSL